MKRGQALARRLRKVYQVLVSMLQEIFDEAAYARFLKQQRLAVSQETYRKFIREQGEVKTRRPKCC